MAISVQKAIKKIQNPFWRAKSNYIKYYDELSICPDMILLESQHGKEFNGNIFKMAQYLNECEKYADFTIYVSCTLERLPLFQQKIEKHNLKKITPVVFSSDEYMKILASAKYLINDNTFMPFYTKKEGQIYLNTWHGTPLKTLGRKIKNDAHMIGNAQKNFVFADYMLFPNAYTKEHMIEDYMLENISKAECIYGGYPRNDVFFDDDYRTKIRRQLKLENVKVYSYMPTFRGTARTGVSTKSDAYMLYYLYELDKQLKDDEILFLNLHPIAKNSVDFNDFVHIRNFPEEYDTYDFLNISDVLVTDYSSVFFDFACTKKKIVLFTFDKEDYLSSRGLYLEMDSLPFPQVKNAEELLQELRAPKQYDDKEFLQYFCPYDSLNSTAKLCDYVILKENTGLVSEPMPNNGKENVLLYAGNLAPNGITASLRNLLNVIDLDKRNYFISFIQNRVAGNEGALDTFPSKVNYYATTGDLNLTVFERVVRKLFKEKLIGVSLYSRLCKRRMEQGFIRDFGTDIFDTVIQFSGYAPEQILRFECSKKNKVIYVHGDMLREMEERGNQRKDVLHHAYQKYDKVAIVTTDIYDSTYEISKKKDNIVLAKNAIPHLDILEKAKQEPAIDPFTLSSKEPDEVMQFINDPNTVKFISVGRFSPEKGHERLVNAFTKFAADHPDARLLIVGGSSYKNHYEKLLEQVSSLHMDDKILLLQRVSNPYALMKVCDYFMLTSYYEGFGLVLAEADIVGLPVVSTDITGPRSFMQKYNGTMVENSDEGIFHGMELLYDNKVKPLGVDYNEYNREIIEQFEQLL